MELHNIAGGQFMTLNYKRTFFVGLAFLSICAFWQLYDSLVPLILSNTFKLNETLTGGIMALDNILALFLLPLFGDFSDKVHTRLGKRTPFIIVGTVIAVIFMMLIPFADQKRNFPLFFISLGLVLLAMGSYRSPAVALMPDLTPKPLRSKANSVINLMGAVGGIFTLIVISLFVPKVTHPDYTIVFLAVAILMIISVVILICTVHENKMAKEVPKEELTASDSLDKGKSLYGSDLESDSGPLPKDIKRSLFFILASIFLWFTAYNGVTTAFSRYAVRVWKLEGGSFANTLLVATAAAIVSYIPIGIISSRMGRKKTIICGIIIMTIMYFTGFLFTSFSPIIYIIFAFTGIGWAAINVNSYPMVVEMSKGANIGRYTGLYYTFSMAAQIFTPMFSGFLLQNVSYRILFPYAFIFSCLSLCTMLLVKHGDYKL